MSRFWEDLAVEYRSAAVSRRRQFPLRMFFILVVCSAIAWRPGYQFMIWWSLANLAVQFGELLALRTFRNHPRPASVIGYNLAADMILSIVFGGLAIPLWQVGTPAAAGAGTMLIAGCILTSLMGAEGCFIAFVASVAPHMVYLAILPFAGGSGDDPVTPYYLLGVSLMALVLTMVFNWSRRAMQAERSARLAAEAQTAAKSAFVAMVSHELRTPINAILNGARALERRSKASRGGASLIVDAGVMMRDLLNDLLDFSKIEAGRMGVEVVDFDLRAVVRDTILLWRGEARAKGIALRIRGARRLPRWVRGDPMRLRQVLNNLLSNAIKFTNDGGVTVSLTVVQVRGARGLKVEVTDTGPGLTDAQVARLFNAYDQLNADTARTFGGTGLGLAISRDLTRLMGGDLTASGAAGGGACFTLALPVPEGVAPPAEIAPQPAVFERRAPASRILVVDDHDINRRALRAMLEAFGVQVETAEDAETALAAASNQAFDAILMDVRMPGVDGLEATRRLRSEGLNRQTPVIAVTGAVSPADIDACLAAGMSGWVEKPVGGTELYAALFGDRAAE